MMRPFVRNRYILLADIALSFLSYILAVLLIFPVAKWYGYVISGINLIAVTSAIYVICFMAFSVYHTDWVYAGAVEYLRLGIGCLAAACISVFVGTTVFKGVYFPKFNIIANGVIIVALCFIRFSIRVIRKLSLRSFGKGKRTLIIGAGNLAVALLRDITENKNLKYNVVGLIDDDAKKQREHIYGSKVIGTRNDIIKICKKYDVEEIIFAIHIIDGKARQEILEICNKTDAKVKVIPGIAASMHGANINTIREIDIEDLLDRDPIVLDNKLIESDITGKTIMVTGGGGSIGSELCRQIIKFKPERLVILDIYENTTYELQNELSEEYPEQKIDVLIASVREEKRIDEIFEKYKPYMVFHAAAHKHVPLMEFSPQEAIKNNVFGTYNVSLAAQKYGVKRFILISTDKAVNPTNVMGATKRMCEMIVQTLEKTGDTEFVAVRFGNVLGSNGSVIPRFKKQIAAGGPVTVTHPNITRFFMTIPEAAQLVLQAAAYAKGGEIFVLDMGEPVKIYDLAKNMISLSGLKLDEDIKIEFTGLRAGEKLYEELLMNEEGLLETAHNKIFVGQPINITEEELLDKLNLLKEATEKDIDQIKEAIAKVVPTYKIYNA